MTPVEVYRGSGPVILGQPHTGTWLPEKTAARLNDRGRVLADTDWHIDRLYDGLLTDATVVRACFHRYVIDANRPPDDADLYPGQNTTGLVPLTDFDGQPIWSAPPNAAEIEDLRARFHAPYHAALDKEINRVRARHGFVILYDCHSIRSIVPHLFAGRLPDLNIGTNSGLSCAPAIEHAVAAIAESSRFTTVCNGRFKGGWTTRFYGRPDEGVHAIQMELAQSTYLVAEAPPWTYDARKAASLRRVLRGLLYALAPALEGAAS